MPSVFTATKMMWMFAGLLLALAVVEPLPTETVLNIDCSGVEDIDITYDECQERLPNSVHDGVCVYNEITSQIYPCPCQPLTVKGSVLDKRCKQKCPTLHAKCQEVSPRTTTLAPPTIAPPTTEDRPESSTKISLTISAEATFTATKLSSTSTETPMAPQYVWSAKATIGIGIGTSILIIALLIGGCVYIARTNQCSPDHDCGWKCLLARLLKCQAKKDKLYATPTEETQGPPQHQAGNAMQHPVPPFGQGP